MGHYNSLVAGGDDPGFADGPFVDARFNAPEGMAVDPSGEKLFIADTGNERIRQVDLAHGDRVTTLAGTGAPGQEDGPFEKASFDGPSPMAFLSKDRLAVFDRASHRLRFLDLKSRTVSSFPGDLAIRDLAYRPADDCLYFTQPDRGLLSKLVLRSMKIVDLLVHDASVPFPKALCIGKDRLYVSDRDSSKIHRMDLTGPGTVLSLYSHADQVEEMAFSDGRLYALQSSQKEWIRFDGGIIEPVGLGTAWGFLGDEKDPMPEAFLGITPDRRVGFLASPVEPRQFFISRPSVIPNAVVSVKDYEFEKYRIASTNSEPGDVVMDYSYPAAKPKGTFRILLAGDSRAYVAPRADSGPPDPSLDRVTPGILYKTLRADTMAKQLEFYLDTDAALRGDGTHYEVLEWNRKGEALASYAQYELPSIVQKYDVDLVLCLAGSTGFMDYYLKPLTHEGVPAYRVDPERVLKPLSRRVPSKGPAADLYRRFKEREKGDTEKLGYPGQGNDAGLGLWEDRENWEDLVQMTGKRLQLFDERLSALRTSGGKAPRMVLFYVPYRIWPDSIPEFWGTLAGRYHFSYLDLSGPYNALKVSYYPAATRCCDGHYTAYGSRLIGYLLSRSLLEQGLIPAEGVGSPDGPKSPRP